MILRLLTFGARSGLILAGGLWIASLFVYVSWAPGCVVTLQKGAVVVRPAAVYDRYAWRIYTRPRLNTAWWPRADMTGGPRVCLPLWMAGAACGLTWLYTRDLTRRRRRRQGQCTQCGYSCISLTLPRCPECGVAFDALVEPPAISDGGDAP